MNWTQFLNWVNDPVRTEAELTQVITALGFTPPAAGAPIDDFRNVLRVHAATQTDLTAAVPAAAVPAGWTPPTPAPAPAPIVGGNMGRFVPLLLGVGGLVVAFLLFIAPGWALGNPVWDELGGGANNQGVSVQQPTATPTATATPAPPPSMVGVSEDRARQIVQEELARANLASREDVERVVNQAVRNALAREPRMTADQVRQVVREELARVQAPSAPPKSAQGPTGPTGQTTRVTGPAGSAPQNVQEAARILQTDLQFLTLLNPRPGDDLVIGWIIGTTATERVLGIQLSAGNIPSGTCVDYDPGASQVTGNIVHQQDFTSMWRRVLLGSNGTFRGLKATVYWTPCVFTDGFQTVVGSSQSGQPAPSACPQSQDDVKRLIGNNAGSWSKLPNEPCSWLYAGPSIGFTVPQGYEVDYDALGRPGKKNAGEAIPPGTVFTLRLRP